MSKDVESDKYADKPERDDKRFVRNMVAFREAHGMSQKELVEKLREQGWTSVYQNTISRIERGERPVRYGEALAIARVFGEPVEKFTLAPEQSSLAISLSMARQRYIKAAVAMAAQREETDTARSELRRWVREAREAGVEPTELPDDDGMLLIPVTVEDELALALADLGEEM